MAVLYYLFLAQSVSKQPTHAHLHLQSVAVCVVCLRYLLLLVPSPYFSRCSRYTNKGLVSTACACVKLIEKNDDNQRDG